MIYTLIVCSNHLTNGHNALQLAEDLIAKGNSINCVYFLFDGAYTANKFIDMPVDEFDASHAWGKWSQNLAVPLLVCNASGLRRGIANESIAAGFRFGSIGELVEHCNAADEVLTL